jgi:hypothetical protein
MNNHQVNRFFTIRRNQLLYLVTMVLLSIPCLMAVINPVDFYRLHARIVNGPVVRRLFGFSLERRRMHYRTQAMDVFVINSIDPNGRLAKAGVRNNDIPVASIHMNDADFYDTLAASRRAPVKLRLINSDEYEKALKDGIVPRDEMRTVVIPRQDER